jgi:putative ABC transport system permease protein
VRRLRFIIAMAWRESRASRRRLLLFGSAISIGVAALVSIGSFTDNLETAVRRESRGLLGADLALLSGRPFSRPIEALLDSLRRDSVPVARRTVFSSMGYVRRTEGVRLLEVRAVEPGFPFYGEVVTSPAGVWHALDTGRVALVDTTVLVSLNARIGDTLEVGNSSFVIAGTVAEVAGHLTGGINAFGAQVYIPQRFVGATGLLVFGSRVSYSAMIKFPDVRTTTRFANRNNRLFSRERVRIETAGEAESDLTEMLQRLSWFLQFIGLVALLLGGIGVASGVGAFLAQKLDTIAVLRCLGASRPLVFAIYVTQAVALGMVAALAGAVLGVGIQLALPQLLKGVLPFTVDVRLEPDVLLEGLAIGVFVALLFALRPLLDVRQVSPLQAIRKAFETAASAARSPRDPWKLAATGALLVGILWLCMNANPRPQVGLGYAGAIVGSVLVLSGTARLVIWGARRLSEAPALRRRWPYVLRQGVANLHQPRNQTRPVVTALGFGVGLLAALYLIQANFLTQVLRQTASAQERPNLVLIDIQADQIAGVADITRRQGHPVVQMVPMVPMRIEAINGRPVDSLLNDSNPAVRPARWSVRREYRSTWRDTLVASERLVTGAMWSGRGVPPAGQPYPLSLSTDVATDLKVDIGDDLTWNVQGARVTTRIVSLREVDWARLDVNFFAVFPTAALERAPATWVFFTRVDDAAQRTRLQRAVVERYPNVTGFDVALLQRTVERILRRVAIAIRFMAAFSLVTGALVLLGAVAAGRLERIRQGALLKTLGATRRQIERLMLSEYVTLGLLSALVGIGLASLGGWAFTRWVLEFRFDLPALPLLGVLAATVALVAVIGLSGSREVFRRTAMEVLREE